MAADTAAPEVGAAGDFSPSRNRFETVVGWLEGDLAADLSHAELEERLQVDARELFRGLLADHLQLRAEREQRLDHVVDHLGVPHGNAEAGHRRVLGTVFGQVPVSRIAYRARGHANLHPADAVLNLPTEKHSHGLRALAAIEASRGSYDSAVDALERATGQHLGKRQVEDLAARAATDFDAFYAHRKPSAGAAGDLGSTRE
jgi:hypothetical protein